MFIVQFAVRAHQIKYRLLIFSEGAVPSTQLQRSFYELRNLSARPADGARPSSRRQWRLGLDLNPGAEGL